MLEWLRSHGVDDVVMSCGHMAAGVRNVLGDGSQLGIRLRFVEEPRPLGTGGAVKFAEELLDERFLMLNGDVLSDMDLSAQIAQHERTGARVTLALVSVEDPSAYGLVRTGADGAVEEFVEKPSADRIDVNTISAGAYVVEREVLGMLEAGEPASIERDVLPALVGEGLHARRARRYWLDIGTPQRYLEASFDILEGTVGTPVAERSPTGSCASRTAWRTRAHRPVGARRDGCVIGEGARVGGRVVLERGVVVGENSVVERAVVLQGTEIGPNCVLRGCIVGGRRAHRRGHPHRRPGGRRRGRHHRRRQPSSPAASGCSRRDPSDGAIRF
jgi:mannose-1-phosphate guanylyltransferase